MKFRPCIDLREGKVVQIIGGTLKDLDKVLPVTNFQTGRAPSEFADMYRKDGLTGGHVISLGPGNTDAALSALTAYPGGLQIGGGITPSNAERYLDAGASHVIVTSYVFSNGRIDLPKLQSLVHRVGKDNLVLDLSCRKKDDRFWIVTDRWQKYTDVAVNKETLVHLASYCDEFLVHGVDVEGRMQGIQTDLVALLGEHCPIPVTYAGGAGDFSDLDLVKRLGQNRVDLTIGSALDIFGGTIPYRDVVKWHRQNNS
ncbi:phosphoribosylformimino-5-aminoimidazole carboxamide ribotide isomerase [Desulfobacula sp.]|uniref:phosphoribosylformimino-5-aminoimidazole carboxamide ribotide isomerase n=1 Tax=Desulfobacula sp. TaxID=2593537 RepID=UPI002604C876|nr:phosphoribosylformimino-5-aminoimidazole carboxamide ribotide isomerase [Desulfobacula sp.]